jgi:hypothetical protein
MFRTTLSRRREELQQLSLHGNSALTGLLTMLKREIMCSFSGTFNLLNATLPRLENHNYFHVDPSGCKILAAK